MFGDFVVGADRSDAELIRQVRAGDQQAYGTLYQRHHAAALRVASKLTYGTRTSADDAVAEAFLRTLDAILGGTGPTEAFRAYLYTVLRNTTTAGSIRDSHSVTVDDFEWIEASAPEHDDPAVTAFESEVVRAAFASTSERWQAVLWYCEIEGMKPAEVAPLLGLSPHGVSVLLTRAREGLREAYLQAHLNVMVAGSACARVAPKLGAFGRDNLAARDRAKVESHLVGCADCAAMAAEVKDVNRGLTLVIALFVLGGSSAVSFGAGAGASATTTAAPAATATPALSAPASTANWVQLALGNGGLSFAGVGVATAVLTGAVAASVSAAVIVGVVDTQVGRGLEPSGQTTQQIEGRAVDHGGPSASAVPPTPTATPTPTVEAVPVAPEPPVAPVDVVVNGGFDAPGFEAVNGSYLVGQQFSGWTIDAANPGLSNYGAQVWYGAAVAAPFTSGPYIGVQGTISQGIQTEAGKAYQLRFEHRASADSGSPANPGWQGGMSGFVLIDGVALASFTTASGAVHSPVTVTFTATSSTTVLAFSTATSVGIDNVSVHAQ